MSCRAVHPPHPETPNANDLSGSSAVVHTYKQVSPARRISRQSKSKKANIKIGRVLGELSARRGEWMEHCGDTVWIRGRCSGCGKDGGRVDTISSNSCGDRFCAACASRRAARLVKSLGVSLQAFQEKRGYHSYLLTLTFRNSETLRSYPEMVKSVRRLLRSKLWKPYDLRGGIRAVEHKVGRNSGAWHSHFHCVVFTAHRIPTVIGGKDEGLWDWEFKSRMQAEWMKITGDSFILDGRVFDGNFAEVIKYVGKTAEMNNGKLLELARAIKGARSYTLFGELYNNPEIRNTDEEEACACEHCGGHSFEWTAYRWDYSQGRYIKGETLSLEVGKSPPGVFVVGSDEVKQS